MYADNITDSMNKALTETNRRREIQQKYNNEHGITPTTIKKAVRDLISISKEVDRKISDVEKDPESMDYKELKKLIEKVKKKMERAAGSSGGGSSVDCTGDGERKNRQSGFVD